MAYYRGKKGIEMGVNIIVMLVIGLTILGLVISFVTGLIGDASSQFDSQLDQTEQQDRQEALDASGIFAVAPSTFTVSPGDDRKVFIKIYNPTETDLTFDPLAQGASTQLISGGSSASATQSSQSGGQILFRGTSVSLSATCNIEVRSSPVTVNANEDSIIIASILPDTGCSPGSSFFMTVEFTAPDGTTKRTAQLSGEITE